MPSQLTDDQLDDELRRVAAAMVADAPPAPAALDDLHAMAGEVAPALQTPPRRWRFAVAAALVALAGLVGGLIVANREDHGHVRLGTGLGDDTIAPQRLVLGGRLEGDAKGEVLADDTIKPLSLGGLDPLGLSGDLWALGDGRHVLLGVPAPLPATEAGIIQRLVVVGADGTVEVDRRVDEPGLDIALLAATTTEAILGRIDADTRVRIVAHNYATGSERLLTKTTLDNFLVDVAGSKLVYFVGPQTEGGSSCRIETLDVVTGEEQSYPLDATCEQVRAVRASPDGSSVAVVYGYLNVDEADTNEVRVAVVDLDDGEVRLDEHLNDGEVRLDEYLGNVMLGCEGAGCPAVLADYLGMAWDDNAHLRVALVDLTATPDGNGDAATLPPGALLIRTFELD